MSSKKISPKDLLRDALRSGKMPHAMIFSGPLGASQTETALWLGQVLFCRKRDDAEPCGTCSDCRLVEQRTHPDLNWLAPEEDSRVIKVEEIRSLISRSGLRPLQAPAKLFVIERADCLNEIAQNAFLKTLEEPEGSTYFILISYADEKLISTIRSRAQQLRFSGTAIAVFPEELEIAERSVTDLILGRPGVRLPDLAELSRDETLTVLDSVARCLRDALLIRVGAEKILGGGSRVREEQLAERLGRETLIAYLESFGEIKEKISRNVNTKLALSTLWEKLG